MKIGFCLEDLGPSQLSYEFITNSNQILEKGITFDIIGFYEGVARPCIPINFATMQIAEAWGFDGILIATSLSTAQKVLKCPSASKKIFLVWDLEWLRTKNLNFRDLREVYANPKLTLVARGADHAKVIEDLWHKKCEVVNGFDLEKVIEVANK